MNDNPMSPQGSQTPATPAVHRRLGDKLAVAAGSGAMAAALASVPTGAQAAIIAASNTPISPPISDGINFWDVDGDGTNDFALVDFASSYASFDDRNGGRLVVPAAAGSDGIAKLAPGFVVGPTLATGFKFWASAQAANTITSSGSIGVDAANGGWSIGDTGYFGFKFTNLSGTHYGWGLLNITGEETPYGRGFTVLKAFYEDTADAPITVVPEPSSLALLALGALGVPAWRRRRKAAAEAA